MFVSLAVFAFMIISFCLNKIPMALTSVIGLLILTITKCIEPSQAVSSICNNTTLTIASMFLLSGALSKTSYLKSLSKLVNKVSKGSFTKVLAGYIGVTFALSQFIPSTTAVFALVCPLVIAMCNEMNIHPSKMLYSIALVTTVGAMTFTPIGPAAANFVENNGYQVQFGITGFTNTPYTEMILKLPPTVFAIVWAIFIAPKFAPEIVLDHQDNPDKIYNAKFNKPCKELSSAQGIITLSVFIAVVLCLLAGSFGFPTWVLPTSGACIVTACGVFSEKEAVNNMGINVVLLYAGVSALGNAFSTTGAGDIVANGVMSLIGHTENSYILGFVFFLAAFVMTSLIYNRAVGKILIPIVLSTAASLSCDPRGLVQMCYIGSMCSLLTPMATSLVPMMMTSAGYSQKDLIRMGIIPSVLLCIVTVVCGMTLYPCF